MLLRKTLVNVVGAFSLFVATSAIAAPIPYSDPVTFSSNNVLSGSGTFNWSHALPSDFEVPFDTVESATLEIRARRASGENDIVSIINFGQLGALASGTGNSIALTSFDVPFGVFTAGWTAGQLLNLSLNYSQPTGNNNTLTMVSSTFNLGYNNLSAPSAAVPEPGSMALLGLGLLSFAASRRRSLNK